MSFLTLVQTHEQTHVSLNARSWASFQERGGPRSVSGGPTEETTITESSSAEMLLATRWSGAEIVKARKLTN